MRPEISRRAVLARARSQALSSGLAQNHGNVPRPQELRQGSRQSASQRRSPVQHYAHDLIGRVHLHEPSHV